MSISNWDRFCEHNTTSFLVWLNGDFTRCFEQSFIICPTHALLALVSIYHYAYHKDYTVPHHVIRTNFLLHLRYAMTILLALLPVVVLITEYFHEQQILSYSDILTYCLKGLSFFFHSVYVKILKRLYHVHIRGHFSVLAAYILTVLASGIELRSNLLLQFKSSHTSIPQVLIYVTAFLHIFYLLTLIANKRPDLNNDENTQLLINSLQSVGHYDSTVRHLIEHELGQAEQAGCFSKLFFLWVKPLMVKGSVHQLTSSVDLFQLPSSLDTDDIALKFDEEINKCSINGIDNNIYVKRSTLLSCLHTSYGCQYYLLGVLKLLSDGLLFAGPILLNRLVSFMEDVDEPIYYGYIYAGGLLISTFLSSIFSSHFNYQVQVVGLKIRASIISMIYSKVIGVNTTSMTKFSTGQIINFMSTDTDRIVNFCPSFHSFWSLPVQVIVSLYLLYIQIGLAFLVGLVFSLLLIPVNKWLANKIQELSTSMMKEKDSRVKVS